MTKTQVIKLLRRAIEGRQGKWAISQGLNPTVLSDVLRGDREPTEQMCALVGVQKTTTRTVSYRKIRED